MTSGCNLYAFTKDNKNVLLARLVNVMYTSTKVRCVYIFVCICSYIYI